MHGRIIIGVLMIDHLFSKICFLFLQYCELVDCVPVQEKSEFDNMVEFCNGFRNPNKGKMVNFYFLG